MGYPSNTLHPVDRLYQVRQQLRELEAEEATLRAALLQPGANLMGDEFVASVADWQQVRVDRKALTQELGADVVARFLRTTCAQTVQLKPRTRDAT